MSEKIVPFEFEGKEIRVVDQNGEPGFVAVDVARALGYERPENAISRHCKAAITTPKQGGGFLTIIPERDVYRLIMRSNLPAAEAFEELVVGTILPAIRKTGKYETPKTDLVVLAEAQLLAARVIEEQRSKLALMAPKAEGYDQLMAANGCQPLQVVGKLPGMPGPNRIFKVLEEKRILFREWTKNDGHFWLPFENHVKAGRFVVKETAFQIDGVDHFRPRVMVTPKGIDYIRQQLGA